MKITFIGYGNMAKAIAKGYKCRSQDQVAAAAPSLQDEMSASGIRTYRNNYSAVIDADIVVLAVKPAQATAVLQEIAADLPKNSVLVSIAAGLNLAWLAQHCRPDQAIIRCMPNTPVAVGKGATALVAGSLVTDQQKQRVERLFADTGIQTWLDDEQHLNALTALSGSGPAYVFLFLEALIKAAEALGVPAELANTFATATLSGSIALLADSGLSPEQLRRAVTSPSGTTEAAILSLQNNGFETIIADAVRTAGRRAEEIIKT